MQFTVRHKVITMSYNTTSSTITSRLQVTSYDIATALLHNEPANDITLPRFCGSLTSSRVLLLVAFHHNNHPQLPPLRLIMEQKRGFTTKDQKDGISKEMRSNVKSPQSHMGQHDTTTYDVMRHETANRALYTMFVGHYIRVVRMHHVCHFVVSYDIKHWTIMLHASFIMDVNFWEIMFTNDFFFIRIAPPHNYFDSQQ